MNSDEWNWRQWATSWFSWLKREDDNHEARIVKLEQEMKTMSNEFDALKASYEANKAEVQADVADLQKKIADLTAAQNSGDTAAAVALTAEITADTAALHASLNPTPATGS